MTVHRNKFLFNKTNRRTNFSKFIFVKKLHVSGSYPAHHQEFSTVHSALVYVMQFWWRLSSTTRSCLKAAIKPAWHIPLPNVQWKTPDDGQGNFPKHVEFLDKNKLGKISASVGFIKKKNIEKLSTNGLVLKIAVFGRSVGTDWRHCLLWTTAGLRHNTHEAGLPVHLVQLLVNDKYCSTIAVGVPQDRPVAPCAVWLMCSC